MSAEPSIAFAAGRGGRPAIEIRVNFGVFAGREATPAEIDRLAERLLGEVTAVTVVAEQRYEVGPAAEASVHLVRVEVSAEHAPPAGAARRALEERLCERAEEWARRCIAERRGETPGL